MVSRNVQILIDSGGGALAKLNKHIPSPEHRDVVVAGRKWKTVYKSKHSMQNNDSGSMYQNTALELYHLQMYVLYSINHYLCISCLPTKDYKLHPLRFAKIDISLNH